jgi:hypothetical protein
MHIHHRSSLSRSALLLTTLATSLGGCGNTTNEVASEDQGAASLAGAVPGQKGALEVRLVDAPTQDVKEIVVTITKVTAHSAGGGGWVLLGDKTATIDLLKLQGGSFVQLGVVQMPPGRITQIRLYVKEDGPNYVTTPDGIHHPLTVPSGPQSGIKIKGGFEWPACATGNVTFDFDGKKSIFVHPKGAGAGDEWLLRPVVRLKSVTATGDGCGPDAGAAPPSVTSPPNGNPPTTSPPTDAGAAPNPPSAPVVMPPSGDPCTNVTCTSSQYCNNGTCAPLIE